MINIFQPMLGWKELKAVKEVFASNWIGTGPKTEEFQKNFSEFIGVDREQVMMTNSCTEGMFQIIEFCKNKYKWDNTIPFEVIIPTIGFVGASNAVIGNGGTPVFCDVDERSLNVTVEDIKKHITHRTTAVMLIHYAGWTCDMKPIIDLCEEQGIILIEDNACSVASTYKGKATGTLGDYGAWSFDAMKTLVMGDGSIVYGRDPKDVEEISTQSYLGLLSDSGYSNTVDKKWWEYDISSPGRRSVVNDITSAIGLVQLERLNSFIHARKTRHEMYDDMLKDVSWIKTPLPIVTSEDSKSSYYMYWIQLEDEQTRDELAMYLKKNDIYTTFRYYPLHLVPYYQSTEQLPNAERASRNTLCLPLHQGLDINEIQYVTDKIKDFK